jgi:feruloyl esterase
MTRRLPALLAAAIVILGPCTGVVTAEPPTLSCTVADLQAKAPAGTTIDQASLVDASGATPAYCQVDASVATPGNAVGLRLGLPATWNGKVLFEGVGGFAGSFGSLKTGLDRGYASASTDTGHRAPLTDASWAAGNPAKVIDYAHRGTHVTAVAAKQLSQAYYGSAPSRAYFNGCSNGGRQALMEAQRYPEDFDGIIAGDPQFGTLGQIRRTLVYQRMLSSPDKFVPASKVALLARKTLESCDGRDGLVDGLISDPRACTVRPETLACSAAGRPEGRPLQSTDTADCLTSSELEIVKAIYADQKTPSGALLHGFPAGHEDGGSGWQQWLTSANPPVAAPDGALSFANPPLGFRFQEGFLTYLASPDGKPIDWRTFSFARDGARLDATMPTFSPTETDLSRLRTRGGKLLLYHGWADPGISALGTLRYYEAVVERAGGSEKSQDLVALFMVPGMHHCQGTGPGPNTFDMVTALDNWVEKGMPPTRVVASHATGGVVDRTRPICAYPMVARYNGTGSIDAAENFTCTQGTR